MTLGPSFVEQRLTSANFSGLRSSGFVSQGSTFVGCSFRGATLTRASMGAGTSLSMYVDCDFTGAPLSFVPGGLVRWERCVLDEVTVRDWFATGWEPVGCRFVGVVMKAVLHGRVSEHEQQLLGRSVNEVVDNDFSGAALLDVSRRAGVDLHRQVLPSGNGYVYLEDAGAALASGEAFVASLDERVRRSVASMLTILREDVEEGQEPLFFPLDDFSVADRSVPEGLVGAIRATS